MEYDAESEPRRSTTLPAFEDLVVEGRLVAQVWLSDGQVVVEELSLRGAMSMGKEEITSGSRRLSFSSQPYAWMTNHITLPSIMTRLLPKVAIGLRYSALCYGLA